MLNCSADGNPPPNITWTRLPSNSPVTFPLVVRRHDEGGYRCSADNGIAIEIIDVFITVQCESDQSKNTYLAITLAKLGLVEETKLSPVERG